MITGQSDSVKIYLANAPCISTLRQFKNAGYIWVGQLIDELNRLDALDAYREGLGVLAMLRFTCY